MGAHHTHFHERGQGDRPPDRRAQRALLFALSLTASFMVVEAAVGWWASSMALLADATHMLNDSAALALSLVAAYLAARPRSASMTYGWRRAEVLAAMVNGVTLAAIAITIVIEAVERLGAPPPVRAGGMLVAASLGLVVNLVVALVLSRAAGSSLNMRAALLHVLGDAVGSGAAIAAGVAMLVFGARWADPVASMVVAVLVTVAAMRLLWASGRVLMAAAPVEVNVSGVAQTIEATEGVAEVHDLHVWSLTPGETVLTAHVVLERGARGTDVVRSVAQRLRAVHGIDHATIQPEAPSAPLVTFRSERVARSS